MCAYGRPVQHTEPVAAEQARPGLSVWDRCRLVLVATWLLLLLLIVAVGQRDTPLADLEGAVAEGRVDSVLVLGHATADGVSTQEVRWTDGRTRRTTRVSVGAAPSPDSGGVPVRSEDIGVLLSRADPDLDVQRSQHGPAAPYGALLGWQVPTWLALTALATYLSQLGFLITVPQTWRATRWAWFWITTVPVAGTALMLLLSGRTPGFPAPATAGRRLTGGWAFLLSSAAGAFLPGA